MAAPQGLWGSQATGVSALRGALPLPCPPALISHPLLQVLASLRSVRSNFSILANVPTPTTSK